LFDDVTVVVVVVIGVALQAYVRNADAWVVVLVSAIYLV